jgi:hypothetical protein
MSVITEKESFLIDDVLTWKDRADFNDYLDKEGYFADTLDNLAWNIHKKKCFRLEEVDDTCAICFKPEGSDDFYSMFLPKDKVHYPEVPKTRPFMSMKEFMEDTGLKVGDVIYLRNKIPSDNSDYVIRLITGLNNDAVILGHIPLYFNTLFENQIFSLDGHSWKGFVHVDQEEHRDEPEISSMAISLIKNNIYKGDDPKIDKIHDGIKGYFFDENNASVIVNIILRNPSTLKSCRYGTLVKIHGELVRCVYKSGEEFYWNYFVPEVIVDKVLELCSKK